MLCGRKRASSRSFCPFPTLFSVHYLLAVGYKSLGKDPVWLAKLARRMQEMNRSLQDWAAGVLGKEKVSGYSSYDR